MASSPVQFDERMAGGSGLRQGWCEIYAVKVTVVLIWPGVLFSFRFEQYSEMFIKMD